MDQSVGSIKFDYINSHIIRHENLKILSKSWLLNYQVNSLNQVWFNNINNFSIPVKIYLNKSHFVHSQGPEQNALGN